MQAALFYLRSRGLDEATARALLIRAFARVDRDVDRVRRQSAIISSSCSTSAYKEMLMSAASVALARALRASTSRASGATSRSCDQQVNGKPLVYLDNAASSQRPRA